MSLDTLVTQHGFAYERVDDLTWLVPGDWLLATPGEDGSGSSEHLTVIATEGQDGFLLRRHGRQVPDDDSTVVVTHPLHDVGQLWRATRKPESGIPGTWCEDFDSNGDHCGLSLHHTRDCRH